MPLKPGIRCATREKNDGDTYKICWDEGKKSVKKKPKKKIKVSTKPIKAPKKSVTKKTIKVSTKPIKAPKKTVTKKEAPKEEAIKVSSVKNVILSPKQYKYIRNIPSIDIYNN